MIILHYRYAKLNGNLPKLNNETKSIKICANTALVKFNESGIATVRLSSTFTFASPIAVGAWLSKNRKY